MKINVSFFVNVQDKIELSHQVFFSNKRNYESPEKNYCIENIKNVF